MADFDHVFASDWGESGGAEPQTGGREMPHAPPPLDAATA